ncbi:hypothetical protein MSP8887_00190 [Marinomonas spartinae]|uniref:DUF6795 domain-containing protein n=1 Tax=Marinomonas spartinae TaxID=1792290 RepID=UPI000808CDBE|nr:DUF6795 domain-containing protein [Marinomonas spartinae]SBS25403.1 hypothetical protein MSP8887_00190 [Marinomonas spartinae]
MFGFFSLKRYDVELSPPIKGRITDNGQPVVEVQVVRKLFYSGYKKEPIFDYTQTNNNGEFKFDSKVIKSSAPGQIFSQDAPILQEVSINNNENTYCLWRISKGTKSQPILDEMMLNLNADLTNKELHHEVDLSKHGGRYNQPVISICYLKSELIKTYYEDEIIENHNELK